MRVLLVGAYPPPYGGVSNLVQRLQFHLEGQGIYCSVLSWQAPEGEPAKKVLKSGKFPMLAVSLVTTRADVVHDFLFPYLWEQRWRLLVYFLAILACRKKWVITVTAGTIPGIVSRMPPLRRRLLAGALARASHVICLNQEILGAIRRLGVPRGKLSCDPFFLPPLPAVPDSLPTVVRDFCSGHRPLVVATGWFERLYNLDLVLEAVRELRAEYPNLGLVMAVGSQVFDPAYELEIKELIARDSLGGSTLLVSDLPSMVPLYQKAQVFVRATSVDGECVSIREALWLGLPVVASDTGHRPEGVLLFEKGNLTDLVQKMGRAIQEQEVSAPGSKQVKEQVSETLAKLLQMYSAAIVRAWT